ncbi:hypothetical protein OG579_06230 [Williamsia herbipolensis]|uniref:Dehydratase n=1 Tax=Williamsia herbipolensis TaxID=1603258 RepID=A0AAU4K5P2_9NOCA|nr:hypothetical protein [Williamsia herbipolensis]
MTMTRRISAATATAAVAAALATVAAGAAAAYDLPDIPSAPYTFDGAATLTVGPGHQPVTFPTSIVAATTNVAQFDGTFTPPAAIATVGGMQYTFSLVDPSKITGTSTAVSEGSTNYTLSATQSFAIRVSGMTMPGVGSGSAGFGMVPTSATCTTAPVTVALTGTINAANLLTDSPNIDTTFSGPVTIPTFADCGALTPIVNAALAGSGNTYSVRLTNAKRVAIQE